MKKKPNYSIEELISALRQKKIICYPTESVFGLGCDPDDQFAIKSLLCLKKRSWKKGLILVAAHYSQLIPYFNPNFINKKIKEKILFFNQKPITWIVPANLLLSKWITGKSTFVAVRISNFEPIKKLCTVFNKPIISTSANISGHLPARTIEEVRMQFGNNTFPIMEESVEGYNQPSEIRNILTDKLIRK